MDGDHRELVACRGRVEAVNLSGCEVGVECELGLRRACQAVVPIVCGRRGGNKAGGNQVGCGEERAK